MLTSEQESKTLLAAPRARMCSKAGRRSAARLWMQSRAAFNAAADLRTPALGRQIP